MTDILTQAIQASARPGHLHRGERLDTNKASNPGRATMNQATTTLRETTIVKYRLAHNNTVTRMEQHFDGHRDFDEVIAEFGSFVHSVGFVNGAIVTVTSVEAVTGGVTGDFVIFANYDRPHFDSFGNALGSR